MGPRARSDAQLHEPAQSAALSEPVDDDDDADGALRVDASDAPPTEQAMVPEALARDRIDRVAATLFASHSRARLQQWIDEGRIAVDGVVAHAKTRLAAGSMLTLRVAPPIDSNAFVAEPIALHVLHEDDAVIVVDKPAGLVVHPAAGHWSGTLLNGLLHRFPELATVPRAGIVHRLDKDTTGLLVIARTLESQTALVRQLQARTVKREYVALCRGRIVSQTVDAPIGRDPRDRQRMAVVANGKPAITHVERVRDGALDGSAVTQVRCRLETGRTHQIRVHLAARGHPLVGDVLYVPRHRATAERVAFQRQALHAETLAFVHPSRGARVEYVAPWPDDLRQLLDRSGIAVS